MANFTCTFTPDLVTGNSLIDTQHKQLIKAIDDLLVACQSGKGRDAISKTLRFMSDYTAKHFSDEEQLQNKFSYPDAVNHKKLHEAFKVTVANLGKKLETDGATIALVGQVNSSVGGWLLTHIKREDVKVAAHIKSKGG